MNIFTCKTLENVKMSTESLKDKTVKGTFWSAMDNMTNVGVSFIISIILARLLSPSEYGILAIIQVFIAISTTIVDSGFSSALIRKKDIKSIDYNTTFIVNVSLSLALYIVLFFCSPLISSFFKQPILLDVTRVVGLILIINGLGIIPRTIFVRTINFKTQMKVSLISSITSGVVGISMALVDMGVWSLVGQQISRQLLNTILLWIASKWKPILEFSKESFSYLFGYGSKMLLSGLLDTIWDNLYYFIIGKFYSSAELGQYTRAQQFNNLFSINLTSVVQRVSYPALSSIQNENERLKQGYRNVIKVTMLVSFTGMLWLFAISKPLIIILIGRKWLIASEYLQIICFIGMLYPLHAINLNILQVKGRSDLFLKLEIIKKIIGVAPICVGIFFGIKNMLFTGIVCSFIAYYLNAYYSKKLINYPVFEQIKDISISFTVSIFVSLIMWSLSFLQMSSLVLLSLQLSIGLILTSIIYEKIKLNEYITLKSIIHKILLKENNGTTNS